MYEYSFYFSIERLVFNAYIYNRYTSIIPHIFEFPVIIDSPASFVIWPVYIDLGLPLDRDPSIIPSAI